MSGSKIRVGILGTGFGASVQLPAFIGLPDAEVIGIASHDPKRSKELQAKHNLPRAFTSFDDLIACDEIDLVSVVTAPLDHERLVRLAIASGKHVLCEKPFTMSSASAKALLKEANAMGIVHAVDFEFRELPALRFLLSRLMTGCTGRMQSAEFRWIVGTWANPERPWRWQCDHEQGGGVLTALGVHLFNSAEWMCGPLQKLRAQTDITITHRLDEQKVEKAVTSEDSASIDLIGTYNVPVHLELSNVDPKGDGLSIDIRGEKSSLFLRSSSQAYGSGLRVLEGADMTTAKEIYRDPVPLSEVDQRIPPFQALASRLLTAIRENDRTFSPSFQDGVRAQLFLEGVHASATTISWVDMGKTSK